MAELDNKKNAVGANDGLSPTPPETLGKLLWLLKYGRKHWPLVLLGGLILCVLFLVSNPGWFSRNSNTKPETFKFVGFEDPELRRTIEEATGLKYDISDNVSYRIEFGHTGTLRPAYQEGYSLFDGGVAAVWINETKCCEIDEIKLQSWPDNPGNPRYLLEAEIEKELREKLEKHRKAVWECIIQCLGDEE